MRKTEDKTLLKKSIIIFSIIVILIVSIVSIILMLNKSKNLKLSDFEKIAVYGYLEDYLSLDKLYLIAGKSSYDDLHYTQAKIKNILDNQYELNPNNIISIDVINSELNNKYSINSNTIDYHGIVVSDYEYLPNEQAFKRVEGANKNMVSLENAVDTTNNYNLSITNIKKLSKDSYIVYFNVVDSSSPDNIHETGNVTIKVVNGTYELETCTID